MSPPWKGFADYSAILCLSSDPSFLRELHSSAPPRTQRPLRFTSLPLRLAGFGCKFLKDGFDGAKGLRGEESVDPVDNLLNDSIGAGSAAGDQKGQWFGLVVGQEGAHNI